MMSACARAPVCVCVCVCACVRARVCVCVCVQSVFYWVLMARAIVEARAPAHDHEP